MLKHILVILLFIIPITSYAEPCYLVIEDSGKYKNTMISNFAISVISQYITKISPIPPAGISSKSCQYRLFVSESDNNLSVSISGNDINGFGDSNKTGIVGMQQAILRAVYRTSPMKKSEICTSYSTIIPSDCGMKSAKTSTLPPVALDLTGNLQVNVNVDKTKIFLNDQLIGIAGVGKPLNSGKVPLGKQYLRVEADGYQSYNQIIDIKPEIWNQTKAILVSSRAQTPVAKNNNIPNEWVEPITGMKFIKIPAGCFQMGSDLKRSRPIHQVCVNDFFLGKYEVTQDEWQKIYGKNPSGYRNGPTYPVETVSYLDIQKFVLKLNQRSTVAFRLPYEAEWEYAAKAGSKQAVYSTSSGLLENGMANVRSDKLFDSPSKDTYKYTAPVGSFSPNQFGVADMTGNVWEWVHDYYDKRYYTNSPQHNPTGSGNGKYRIFRGGSFNDANEEYLSTSYRYLKSPKYRKKTVGFRLAFQL